VTAGDESSADDVDHNGSSDATPHAAPERPPPPLPPRGAGKGLHVYARPVSLMDAVPEDTSRALQSAGVQLLLSHHHSSFLVSLTAALTCTDHHTPLLSHPHITHGSASYVANPPASPIALRAGATGAQRRDQHLPGALLGDNRPDFVKEAPRAVSPTQGEPSRQESPIVFSL
jgi:hypothetical protein